MAYSYSSSTQSGTSSGTTVSTTTNDESSSTSTTVDMTTQTSSPDDSDGLAAEVGGSAVASGEDTLATGDLSGELIDSGAVTSADLSATMVAASEDPDSETAGAWTDTYADVSDGTEVLFSYTVNTENTTQGSTGSTATATSTTNLVAYDINTDTVVNTAGSDTGDEPSDTDDQPESSSPSSDVEDDGDFDGNFASMEFDAFALGDDTLVEVDAFTFVVEDEISISEGIVLLGVD
jgi:hypothetical protein